MCVNKLKSEFLSGFKDLDYFYGLYFKYLLKHASDNYKIVFDERFGGFNEKSNDAFSELPELTKLFPKDKEMEKILEKKYIINLNAH